MKYIGLTGVFGAGKSTAADLLQSLGATILDADIYARSVCQVGSTAHTELVQYLGSTFFHPDGQLNRTKLAQVVFSDKTMLNRIEQIIHPAIQQLHQQDLNQIYQQNNHQAANSVVVYVVPLLFEKQWHQKTQKNIVITCNKQTILDRLAKKGFSHEVVEQRWNNQLPAERKKELADYCADNSFDRNHLKIQLTTIWDAIKVLPNINFSHTI